MKIYSIGESILEHWDWVEPYLTASLKRNVDGITADDVLENILDQRSIVLVIESDGEVLAVGLLDILPECLHVHTMTGHDLNKWLHMSLEACRSIARGLGLKYITSVSRPGMKKLMTEQEGFKVKDYYMVHEVQS